MTFHYSGGDMFEAADVGWYEEPDGGTCRGAYGAKTNKYRTLQNGDNFEIFLPDTSRTLVVTKAGTSFKNPFVVQPLNVSVMRALLC